MGRLPSPPDARDYLMVDAVRELERLPRPAKRWQISGSALDQLKTPHCVGFSWCAWGISAPVEQTTWGNAMGHDIYAACKVIDGEPGRENGSTLRSGAKVMKARKRISTYFFAHSVHEALDYVARFGPVVFGTVFTEGMCKPSFFGKIIRPTGKVVGGHAWLAIGVDGKYVTIRNSWGTGWGKGGEARISIADLEDVYMSGGEACAASELALPIGGANA
jgi:hypothetical protein